LPKKLITRAVPSVMPASTKFAEAIPYATGTRLRPMTIIIGPTTRDGKYFLIVATPTALTKKAKRT